MGYSPWESPELDMTERLTHTRCFWASQVALGVKNPPANVGDIRDVVPFLSREDPLEEGMATHSSILAWRIPWTEDPGGWATVHGVTKSWIQL